MDIALQLFVNTLIPGSIFALATVGFSLIYSVTRTFHVAQGAVLIAAGYAFYAGISMLALPVWAAVLFALAAAVLLGVLMNSLVYERMRTRAAVSTAGTLIATLSLLLIVENTILAYFGSSTKTFLKLSGSIHEFGPVLISTHEIRILVITPIILFVLVWFLRKSRIGKALRAVAEHETVAEVVGISSKKMRTLAFVIGSFLAGISGIFFAIEYNLEPSMSTMAAVRIFIRAILGGVGSIGGGAIGSYLTEAVMQLTGWYWNMAWIDFMSFVVAMLILIVKPAGLFGKKKRSV